MSGLAIFRKLTVDGAARQLDLHPFDVIRLLVADGGLPKDLRLEAADVERARQGGGLETWWDGAPPVEPNEPRARTLARGLIARFVARDLVDPRTTRADNLFRGLDSDGQVMLRRAVNVLIKEQLLVSRMDAQGLRVGLVPASLGHLRDFAAGEGRLLDSLWEQL